jgi:hypothetical protein
MHRQPSCAADERDELAGASFDYLVGAGKQRRWHFEAERQFETHSPNLFVVSRITDRQRISCE